MRIALGRILASTLLLAAIVGIATVGCIIEPVGHEHHRRDWREHDEGRR